MPVELAPGLRRYMLDDCRHEHSPACLWYDHERRACRNYDWARRCAAILRPGRRSVTDGEGSYQIEVSHDDS